MSARKFYKLNPITGRLAEVIEDRRRELARVIVWDTTTGFNNIETYGLEEIDRAIAYAANVTR
jgi:hypothetical protein